LKKKNPHLTQKYVTGTTPNLTQKHEAETERQPKWQIICKNLLKVVILF
jgi:hypothetical protein